MGKGGQGKEKGGEEERNGLGRRLVPPDDFFARRPRMTFHLYRRNDN